MRQDRVGDGPGTILEHAQETQWRLTNSYLVQIAGNPNVKLKMSFAPADFDTFNIGPTTAMPAINAARPGCSPLDLALRPPVPVEPAAG